MVRGRMVLIQVYRGLLHMECCKVLRGLVLGWLLYLYVVVFCFCLYYTVNFVK